jgi:putative transposase
VKRKRFSPKQIVTVLKQVEVGVPVVEVVRRSGISEQTFYRWKRQYVGLEVDRTSQLKQLENNRLKQLVADLTLDKRMLQDVLSRILAARQRKLDHDGTEGTHYRRVRRPASRNATLTESRERILIQ